MNLVGSSSTFIPAWEPWTVLASHDVSYLFLDVFTVCNVLDIRKIKHSLLLELC